MSIRCGHCGGLHDSVADVRQCSTENAGNMTDAEHEVAAIVRYDDTSKSISPCPDPWEGAVETTDGVWLPGPARYLDAYREQARERIAPPVQIDGEWAGYRKVVEELTEGFYAMDEGIYQTVMSGKGRLYAKALNEDTGQWTYAAGAVMKLKPEMRLKLDDAKNFGHRTGRCCCCGRTLTNPVSIENGIGPICAERYF